MVFRPALKGLGLGKLFLLATEVLLWGSCVLWMALTSSMTSSSYSVTLFVDACRVARSPSKMLNDSYSWSILRWTSSVYRSASSLFLRIAVLAPKCPRWKATRFFALAIFIVSLTSFTSMLCDRVDQVQLGQISPANAWFFTTHDTARNWFSVQFLVRKRSTILSSIRGHTSVM